MKKALRNIMLGIMMCACVFCIPVHAAEDMNTVFEQGNTYATNGEYEEAIECYEKVIEMAEAEGLEIDNYVGCYRNIAISYGDLGWNYKAIEVLHTQEVLLEEANSTKLLPEVYMMLSKNYYDIGVYQTAIEYGKKAIEMAPHKWIDAAYRITGLALMETGWYEEAITYFEVYCDNSGNELHGLDLLAQCYEAMGEYDVAVEIYLEIANAEEYRTTYTEHAAEVILKDNMLTEDERNVFVEDYLVGMLGYGEAELKNFYSSIRDYDKVFEYYEKALEQDPDNLYTLYNFGGAKCNNGDYAEAEELFRKVYENAPDFGNTVLYLGYALEGQGKYEEALEMYHEALAMNPGNTSIVLEIKDCYLALGNREEALSEINNVVLNSENVGNSLLAQYVNLNFGFSNTDFSDEIAYYSQSDEWPDDEKQQAYFIINNISISCLTDERLDAYINYLESLNVEDYLIACELGYCYRNKGDYAKALDYLEQAKQLAPYYTEEILEDQIEILYVAGDDESAIYIGHEASDIFPDNEYIKYYAAFVDLIYNQNYDVTNATAKEMLSEDSDSTNALELLYMGYMGMGDYETALQYVNQYLEADSNSYYAMAYKLRILRELGQTDAELESKIANMPISASYSNTFYVPAILGDVEKVKEYLPKYLELYPSAYTKSSVAKNTAMQEVISNPEIAQMLGLEVVKENVESENIAAEESSREEQKTIDVATMAKTAGSAVIMILGIAIVVINIGKIKKSKK